MERQLASTTRYWGGNTTKRACLVWRVSYHIRGIIPYRAVQPANLKSQKQMSFGLHWIRSSLICFPTWNPPRKGFVENATESEQHVPFLPGPPLPGTKETKELACRPVEMGWMAVLLPSPFIQASGNQGTGRFDSSLPHGVWAYFLCKNELSWTDLTLDHAAWEISSLANKALLSHSPFKSIIPH